MKLRYLLPLSFLGMAALVWACTAPVSVSLSPGSATLLPNTRQQFVATVTGNPLSTTAVTWNVNSIAGGDATVGTVDANGLYTAPGSVPTPATVSVTAVSVADPSKSATAAVTVSTSATPSIASISPASGATAGGTAVTLSGSNFGGGGSVTGVTFGGVSATSVLLVDPNTITAVTPAGTGTVNIVETNADASTATLTSGFTYASTPSPSGHFWGMDVNNTSHPWPFAPITFSVFRIWDTNSVKWSALQPTCGSFSFTALDSLLDTIHSHSISYVDYVGGAIPSCAGGSNVTAAAATSFWTGVAQHSAARKSGGHQGIDYYELLNEPNNCSSGGSCVTNSTTLARYAKAAYNAIRANDPTATIITPSFCYCLSSPWSALSSFLSAAQSLGGTGFPFADVIGYHNYLGSNPKPENIVSGITQMRSAMATYSLSSLELINTEWSWGQDTALPDRTQQANFLARSEILAASKGVPFWWYGWDFCCWGTLWDASGGEHSAGRAYGELSSFWLNGSTVAGYSVSGTVYQVPITLSGGSQRLAVWNTAGSSTFAVPVPYQGQTWHDIYGNTGTVGTSITIGLSPLLL